MDTLYNIFQREKNRVGDKFTIFYNENQKSIFYKNDKGILTVIFDSEKGEENFYFKTLEDKGIGDLVQHIEGRGKYGELELLIFELPKEFIELAQSYQYERDLIGVEKIKKKEVKGDFYER